MWQKGGKKTKQNLASCHWQSNQISGGRPSCFILSNKWEQQDTLTCSFKVTSKPLRAHAPCGTSRRTKLLLITIWLRTASPLHTQQQLLRPKKKWLLDLNAFLRARKGRRSGDEEIKINWGINSDFLSPIWSPENQQTFSLCTIQVLNRRPLPKGTWRFCWAVLWTL